MGQTERSLKDLGRRVARLQDASPAAAIEREIAVECGGFVDLAVARRARRRRTIWLSTALAAALSLVALVVLVLPRAPLVFRIGDGGAPGIVGTWLAAPKSAALPIRFSDGSRLELGAGGRARITAAGADGAEIALESGALDLSIVHRARTRWRVDVGPFQVAVIGTSFETSWDPIAELFSVALHEGVVSVSGPIVGEGRIVRAGERITVSPRERSLTTAPLAPTSAEARPVVDPSQPVAPAPSSSPSPAAESGSYPPAIASTSSTPTAPSAEAPRPLDSAAPGASPSWRDLAKDSRYKDALAAAEAVGFDEICKGASARDLHALADAARLGGDGKRAQQAFRALLERFPASSDAGYALFMLGRAAADQRRDYAGAALLLAQYLREQPGGPFAEEASGRFVEATDKMGDDSGARRAAARYLERYPTGSHADYARRVLARANP